MKWTERRIQQALFHYMVRVQRIYTMVPNFEWGLGEIDLVALDRTRRRWDFEIKVTRSDFRADFKKEKHYAYRDELTPSVLERIEDYETRMDGIAGIVGVPRAKAEADLERLRARRPKHFYYAAPKGIVPKDEVPEYAGLIEVDGDPEHPKQAAVRIVRRAPVLVEEPEGDELIYCLLRRLSNCYWYKTPFAQ